MIWEKKITEIFREALLKTNSNEVALLGFKKNGKDILYKDWEYIYLIDGVEENTGNLN